MSRIVGSIFRFLIYLWVLPTTFPGLLLAMATILSGGHVRVVRGVLEISGGASEFYLRRIVGLVMSGGASAITLGHVVAGRNLEMLDVTRDHERVHVHQWERWGPFFFPAYLIASLVALLRGRRPYEDNFFEVEAFARAKTGC